MPRPMKAGAVSDSDSGRDKVRAGTSGAVSGIFSLVAEAVSFCLASKSNVARAAVISKYVAPAGALMSFEGLRGGIWIATCPPRISTEQAGMTSDSWASRFQLNSSSRERLLRDSFCSPRALSLSVLMTAAMRLWRSSEVKLSEALRATGLKAFISSALDLAIWEKVLLFSLVRSKAGSVAIRFLFKLVFLRAMPPFFLSLQKVMLSMVPERGIMPVCFAMIYLFDKI